jgi:hypothetical protein
MTVTIPSLARRQVNWWAISAGIFMVGYACIAGVVCSCSGAWGRVLRAWHRLPASNGAHPLLVDDDCRCQPLQQVDLGPRQRRHEALHEVKPCTK